MHRDVTLELVPALGRAEILLQPLKGGFRRPHRLGVEAGARPPVGDRQAVGVSPDVGDQILEVPEAELGAQALEPGLHLLVGEALRGEVERVVLGDDVPQVV